MHHKICHVLGETFNLPHAQTHATVLPYVLVFNAPAAPAAAARIAAALGTDDALQGLWPWAGRHRPCRAILTRLIPCGSCDGLRSSILVATG